MKRFGKCFVAAILLMVLLTGWGAIAQEDDNMVLFEPNILKTLDETGEQWYETESTRERFAAYMLADILYNGPDMQTQDLLEEAMLKGKIYVAMDDEGEDIEMFLFGMDELLWITFFCDSRMVMYFSTELGLEVMNSEYVMSRLAGESLYKQVDWERVMDNMQIVVDMMQM